MSRGKHILVTGGTGYLGPDIIKNLLEKSYTVTSISRHSVDLKQFNFLPAPDFEHILHDINNKQHLREILERSVYKKGKFDGLIVMANKASRRININEDENSFLQNMGEGPKTTFVTLSTTHEFLNMGSSIIIFGSIWGMKTPYQKLYLDLPVEPSLSLPASKAALIQLMRSFADQFAKDKIRVNLITPGWFPKPGKVERKDYIEGIVDRTPLGRIGIPSDLVGPINFLLDNSSNFITGHNLIVDGGFSIY